MVLGVVRGWCCVVGAGGVVQVFVEGREHVGYLLAGGVLGPVASVHLCDQCPLSSRFDGTDAFDTFVLLQDSAYLLSSVAALLLSDVFSYCFANRSSSDRVCSWNAPALVHEVGDDVAAVAVWIVVSAGVGRRCGWLRFLVGRAVQHCVVQALLDGVIEVVWISR